MQKLSYYLFGFILLAACSETPNQETDSTKQIPEASLTLEERLTRKVEAKLRLPASEKYSIEFYWNQLNADQVEDAIITVNRREYGINLSLQKGNSGNAGKTGFVGPFNTLFYYDGQSERLSAPMNIGSSALHPLKVRFANLQSPNFQDALIDYRIGDAGFRNYLFSAGDVAYLALQHKIFDSVLTQKPVFYTTSYEPGRISDIRDVIVYKAENSAELPETVQQDFEPKITARGDVFYHFFYRPRSKKYAIELK